MIELHSYMNAFDDNKLRPGFRDPEGNLWVFSHTKPRDFFILVPTEKVVSKHFKPKTSTIYLTLADNQCAHRYNNVSGGDFNYDFLTLKQHICTMKKTLNITHEQLGLSAQANLQEVLEILGREKAGTLKEEDKAYTTLEKWPAISQAYGDLLLKEAISALPFEGEVGITDDNRKDLNEAVAMLQTEPTSELAISVLTEAGLTYVVSPPASEEALQSVVTNTAADDAAVEDAPQTEAPATDTPALDVPPAAGEPEPSTQPEESSPLPEAPKSTVPAIASTGVQKGLAATVAANKEVLNNVRTIREQVGKLADTVNTLTDSAIEAAMAASEAAQASLEAANTAVPVEDAIIAE